MDQSHTNQGEPGTVSFTQKGIVSIAILLPLLIFSIIMIFVSGSSDDLQPAMFSFLAFTFLSCLLVFYKITITINDAHVSFSLGIGLVRRNYPLQTIAGCIPVVNSPLTGIGIRLIRNGWLYNVSGSKAVELRFTDRKQVVRIGTDNPEAVAAEINRRLKVSIETGTQLAVHNYWYLALILVVLLIFLPALLIIKGSKPSGIRLSDRSFTIDGMYGLTVNYSNIRIIDTVASLPRIKMRTNGFASGSILKGNFRMSDKTKAKLFVNTNNLFLTLLQ
jgi:hypothetical protein